MNDTPWPEAVILDPTDERTPPHRPRVARLAALEGRTVGLLDISKARGDVFLDRLEELLAGRGVRVERFRKPTFSRPAPAALYQDIVARCDAVVEALAD